MAIVVKDAASSALKFVQRAQAAAPDYTKGVQNAGPSWQANTVAAADTWAQGVQGAISNGRFTKGVNGAGAGKYSTNAAGKGALRYPQGVASAGPAWQENTQPYLQTIAGLQLPPRRMKGDPGNIARVQAVTTALRAKKVGNA